MEGPRAPYKEEFPRVLTFLNENLRPNLTWSIANEYPLALNPSNLGNMRVIIDGESVLSHAVLRPLLIKSPAGLFKVAAIGSVVTSSHHRSLGLSSQIIKSCLQSAEEQNCDFAILWTDIFDFYRKMDFELCGSEIALIFDKPLSIESQLRILDTPQVDPEAIHRLYQSHRVTTVRSVEDIRKYLQIPNSKVYTAWDSAGLLKAYAVEGKGADLTGYIHEWGGNVTALLELISFIRNKKGNNSLTVIIPSHSQNLLRRAKEAGAMVNHGHLGMLRLIQPKRVIDKILRYAKVIGAYDLHLELKNDILEVGDGKNHVQLSDRSQILNLIFGPKLPQSLSSLPAESQALINSVFPIPMWIWGWDSI